MNASEMIKKAVALLKSGGLVAMPTETVYGLAADASNEQAVRKIFKAKERPYDHPLIVHIPSILQLSEWARDISPDAKKIAQSFWPGPLTLILKKQKQVLPLVTGGQDTVGIRIPNHPIAQALLQQFGRGLAAPSANKFTHLSPTNVHAVEEELADSVDMILDGGDCVVGLESTILDLSGDKPVILRPGMITANMLSEVLGKPISPIGSKGHFDREKIRAPGMHHLHYSPLTKTLLIDKKNLNDLLHTFSENDLPIGVVTHSDFFISLKNIVHVQLSQDAKIYAHDLYRVLRELDHSNLENILIEMVPEQGEWEAIRDRLSKACGNG